MDQLDDAFDNTTDAELLCGEEIVLLHQELKPVV